MGGMKGVVWWMKWRQLQQLPSRRQTELASVKALDSCGSVFVVLYCATHTKLTHLQKLLYNLSIRGCFRALLASPHLCGDLCTVKLTLLAQRNRRSEKNTAKTNRSATKVAMHSLPLQQIRFRHASICSKHSLDPMQTDEMKCWVHCVWLFALANV